jgi:hypothetical protein
LWLREKRTCLAAARAAGQTAFVPLPANTIKAWTCGLLAALLCWALVASSQALAGPQRPKGKSAPITLSVFAGDLRQARSLAKERNVPIVAVPLLDGEDDNTATRDLLLTSAEFAALSHSCVFFFSNHTQHPLKELVETVDGVERKRSVCSAFLTPTCKQHQQHWDEIYNNYNDEGDLRCPQVLLLEPDGKLAQRITPGHKPEVSVVVSEVADLQKRLGRGLNDAQLAQLKDAIARAARARTEQLSGSEWRAWQEVLEISPDGARAQSAKAGQLQALEQLAAKRAASEQKLAGDQRLAGYLELEMLTEDWKGHDQGGELTRLLRRAEKDPLLREELAKKKLEDDAQALWDEAQALFAAKQPKDAERKVRLLLRKFEGTRAFGLAAKAHPEWLPEPPAK